VILISSSIPGLSPNYFLPLSFALPEDFVDSIFADGFSNPTSMAFAPDGRLFVAENGGDLRVVKNGSVLATPFLSVSVDSDGERGLNGITFDPDFTNNGFVYVYYTTDDSSNNRISQFTADPANPDVALAGSEVEIFNLDDLSSSTNHNGGALHFGSDGKLYAAIGDAGSSSNSQDLSTNLGKIIRINSDGTIPSDNPFFNTSGAEQEIWALGLRNPFTFAFSADTNKMHINDVGQDEWEEVNLGLVGKNYGWPTCEGLCSPPDSDFEDPIYTYNHSSGGFAITGGVFYESNQFPASYYGSYFFGDYVKGFIDVLSPSNVVTEFHTADSPVDFDVGPDGSLYYLSYQDDEVHKVEYIPDNAFPTANLTANPLSGLPPLTVDFDGSSSSDPDTGTILSFLWDFGDGTTDDTSGDTVSHIYTQLGPYDATLTVDDGEGGVDSANVTIEVGNPPLGTITSPSTGLKYNAGDVINFVGTGIDTQDNSALPDSAFEWTIIFHHNTHTHPFTEFSGITQGAFTIPTLGETASDVWYRIQLTTTNSIGLSRTVSTDVTPNTSTVTIDSDVTGLQVKLDGQPKTTPTSFVGVVGQVRELQAVTPQNLGGVTYEFKNWSDAGDATHSISTPSVDTTYTVNHTIIPNVPITFDNSNSTLCSDATCPVLLDVAPGSDRVIIVGSTEEGDLNPIVSIDVNAGTSQGILVGTEQVGSGATEQNVEMWRIPETAIPDGATTVTVTINYTSEPSDAGVSLTSFSGVKQQAPDAVATGVVTSSDTVSVTVTTQNAGSLLFSIVGTGQGGGDYLSHGADQIERHDFTVPSAWQAVTTEIKAVAGPDTQLHVYNSDANRQAQVVGVFAPAAPPVPDNTPPVITLLGTTPIPVEAGSLYTDAGATALDDQDGNITPSIVIVNPVVTTAIATFTVTYDVADSAGNPANQVTRTVNVVDNTPPVITLLGATVVSVVVGSAYTDAGATAFDNLDGNITPLIATVNPVVTTAVATFTVTYDVTDSASNPATQVTRTVNVVAADITDPVTTATPAGGTYTSAQTVTLTVNEPATIYYTLNGTMPTTSSAVYSTPLSIPTTSTLKFFAVDTAGNTESVNTEEYTINVPPQANITYDTLTNTICDSNPCSQDITIAPGSDRVIIVGSTEEGDL